MRGNSHARCGVGENSEITSKNYLSLYIIPPDIETYSEEAHGLLKEMQSRNERLFKVTFLITSFNENLQKMKDFRFTLSNNIQSANCALRKLDHQQEQGLISSLPLGKNFIKQKRYLTTSSTAVFVPFTTQELFMDSKESLYMGLNSLSNGMIMADRKLLKNPNGLIRCLSNTNRNRTIFLYRFQRE